MSDSVIDRTAITYESEVPTQIVHPASKKATGTEYVVLRQSADQNIPTWVEASRTDARSAHAAIRIVAEKAGEGKYVAVPSRSFQPVTVKRETQTKLTLK